MSQIARLLVAALSLAGLWFLAMVLEAVGVPVWVLVVNGVLLVVNVMVLTGSIYQATREEDNGDGDGGLPPHRPDVPDSGGGDQPSWWPELERELAQYLADHDRGPERVPVGSADLV